MCSQNGTRLYVGDLLQLGREIKRFEIHRVSSKRRDYSRENPQTGQKLQNHFEKDFKSHSSREETVCMGDEFSTRTQEDSFFKKINLFIFGCIGSSLLRAGFLYLRRAGATPRCGAWASHCGGFSCCGAQAPGAQAQQLWRTDLVAPRHVGSSQTRTRTCVPCFGRQILFFFFKHLY